MSNGPGQLEADAVIDTAVDLFEREQKAGNKPRVADYLHIVAPEMRVRLLEELACVEFEYRCKTDGIPNISDYASRFPGISDHPQGLERLRNELQRIQDRCRQHAVVNAAIESAPAEAAEVPTLAPQAPGGNGRSVVSESGNGHLTPPRIGRYVILEIISVGKGQADVFRVAHPNLNGEFVLKRFRPRKGLDTTSLIEEGRKLSTLRDILGIAKVYDADVIDGQPFIVLEYIPGRTLGQFAKQEQPKARHAAQLVAAIARGLGAAHRLGISHLDIKPPNILIDTNGRPKLIDFGIARSCDAWQDQSDPDGIVSGTPAYMPPEQAQGRNEQVGPRSDVFSLGAVLFFLLTGRPPYDGNTVHQNLKMAGEWQWDQKALKSSIAQENLKRVCAKALSKEPADRYANGDAFADALESLDRSRRIRQWTIAGAGAIAVMVCIGLAWRYLFPADAVEAFPIHVQISHQKDHWNDVADLSSARIGDQIRILATIPKGRCAALFSIDAAGKKLIQTISANDSREFGYSAAISGTTAPDTELLVMLSSLHPIGDGALPWPEKTNWPALPAGTVLKMDNNEVQYLNAARGLDPSGAIEDACDKVRYRMEELHKGLSNRIDGFEAIAFRLESKDGK